METSVPGLEVLWREEIISLDYFKKLIELANSRMVVCTFGDKSVEEVVVIVIDNNTKIAIAIKNILEKNKIKFEKVEDTKYDKLIILLLIWRTGFILKKSEINILEKALAEAGAKIDKNK